jgi:radical SAM protein with 4Fe4S-binding SPASM domain
MPEYPLLRVHLRDAERRAELLAIEAGLREHPFPPQLVVENTSYCNMKCSHCAHRVMVRPQRHMDRALWERIVAEVGRESPECELWPTFYGEALILRGELWDRLDSAARAGCRNLVLNSNGSLLDRFDHIDSILRSPLRRFILSLDGFTAETFEKIRVGGKRDPIFAAVEELCCKRRERGQHYPVIVVQFSVMKENAHELEAFTAYWRERGAEVKSRPMLEWGNTGAVKSDGIVHDPSWRLACPWANNTCAIHADGSVVACAVDYEGRFCVGNVCDGSIRELWTALGSRLRRLHREHRWTELPALCQGCGDWQVAGAKYDEQEQAAHTRPFWFYDRRDPPRRAG